MEEDEKNALDEQREKRFTEEEYQHYFNIQEKYRKNLISIKHVPDAPQKFKMSECEKDYWLYMILISFVLIFFKDGILYIPIIIIFFCCKIIMLRDYIKHNK